ncbi:hypothetical protein F4809DRAFT_622162 [Biscogniauxia mediterranea]|nr:hypothetical protein F4809DRAFT_622162 [Biscogniauxia mediterranea]
MTWCTGSLAGVISLCFIDVLVPYSLFDALADVDSLWLMSGFTRFILVLFGDIHPSVFFLSSSLSLGLRRKSWMVQCTTETLGGPLNRRLYTTSIRYPLFSALKLGNSGMSFMGIVPMLDYHLSIVCFDVAVADGYNIAM